MIVLMTSLWDRPDIEEIMLDYYASLRNNWSETLLLVAAHSEETQFRTLDRARELGWYLVDCPSAPLGLKLNTASRSLQHAPFVNDISHVVTFGSDDLIHPEAFKLLRLAGKHYACAGFSGAYFLCTQTWRAAHFEYPPGTKPRPCGAGRIMQRQVLELLDWAPRDDTANNKLDGSMDARLREHGIYWYILDHKTLGAPVIDVKTSQNLSTFETLLQAGATLIDPGALCETLGHPWTDRLHALRSDPIS
jgi:hypothetical protein